MTGEEYFQRLFGEAVYLASPFCRAAVIQFDLISGPDLHTLYSDAAAADLVLVLKALLSRIESGALRMPVNGGVRWVEEAA